MLYIMWIYCTGTKGNQSQKYNLWRAIHEMFLKKFSSLYFGKHILDCVCYVMLHPYVMLCCVMLCYVMLHRM